MWMMWLNDPVLCYVNDVTEWSCAVLCEWCDWMILCCVMWMMWLNDPVLCYVNDVTEWSCAVLCEWCDWMILYCVMWMMWLNDPVLCYVNDVTEWSCTVLCEWCDWMILYVLCEWCDWMILYLAKLSPFLSWSWLHNQLAQWNYWLLLCILGPAWSRTADYLLGKKLHPTSLGRNYTNHFHRRTTDFQSLLWGDLEQNCWLSAGENSVLIPWSWLHSWLVAFCVAHYWVTAALHSFSSSFLFYFYIHWSGMLLVVIWMLPPATAAIWVHLLCMFFLFIFLRKRI